MTAASAEEDIAWDEDSEDEDSDDSDEDSDDDTESEETKPAGKAPAGKAPAGKPPVKSTGSAESSKTLHPPTSAKKTAAKKVASTASVDGLLKPGASPRKSDEKSVADSEASYDIVGARSGVPSQAPNSPQRVEEDSEEEDWE